MASLAVAAALSIEPPDPPSICPLSRLQRLWVWLREPRAEESLVLFVLKIFISITGSEKW